MIRGKIINTHRKMRNKWKGVSREWKCGLVWTECLALSRPWIWSSALKNQRKRKKKGRGEKGRRYEKRKVASNIEFTSINEILGLCIVGHMQSSVDEEYCCIAGTSCTHETIVYFQLNISIIVSEQSHWIEIMILL